MMTTQAPSAEDTKATFVCVSLDRIERKPIYDSLAKMEQHATRNAASIDISANQLHKNLAGIAQHPHICTLRSGSPFPSPTHPGNAPEFPNSVTVAQRQATQQLYSIALRNHTPMTWTENLLKNMIERAVDNTHLKR